MGLLGIGMAVLTCAARIHPFGFGWMVWKWNSCLGWFLSFLLLWLADWLLRSLLFRKLTGYLLFIFILLFTTHLFGILNEMICWGPWGRRRRPFDWRWNPNAKGADRAEPCGMGWGMVVEKGEPWFWNSIEITHKSLNAAARLLLDGLLILIGKIFLFKQDYPNIGTVFGSTVLL